MSDSNGKILIQDGDDWVKVFVNGKLVMENHGHAGHWKGLYVAAMRAQGAEVTEQCGYFNDNEEFEADE